LDRKLKSFHHKTGVAEETLGIGTTRAISCPIAFEIPVEGLMHPIEIAALWKVAVAAKK
jgi:hypothetical protein